LACRYFLEVPEAAWVCVNELAFAFRDRFPVSPGHTLIVTRRVTPDWFSATDDEQRAVLALVAEVKRQLDDELAPDGYNVGFNAGAAAGQTVMHLHVHVIPGFVGTWTIRVAAYGTLCPARATICGRSHRSPQVARTTRSRAKQVAAKLPWQRGRLARRFALPAALGAAAAATTRRR
jgi:diadenosine tetraphosphate (Ap4A) HIT family hydrolase